MDLAFVGSAQQWQRFNCWFGSPFEHRLVGLLPDPAAAAWGQWPPGAKPYDDFEELLSDPQIHALILAGSVSLRAERLRRAAQAGRICLLLHPGDLSATVYHELAMIAEDTRAILVPMFPGRLHPAYQKLVSLCRSDFLSKLQVVRVDRVGPALDGRVLVADRYAEAADLLCGVIDEIVEVTAVGDLTSGRLLVQHRTASGVVGEIRLAPGAPHCEQCNIRVAAEQGTAELTWDAGFAGPAALEWSAPDGDHAVELPGPTAGLGLLEELAQARAGRPHTLNWQDGIRAAELAECVLQSLLRRRSVDVYHERHNELTSFKGTMTSCGCGLIWVTLALLLLIAAGKGLGIPGMDWLAVGIAVLWLIFLSLQLFRLAFPREQPG